MARAGSSFPQYGVAAVGSRFSGDRSRLAVRSEAVLTAIALIALAGCLGCKGRATGATDSVNLADCDEYITKVNACMAKDPHMRAMEPAFRAQEDAWKQMARTDTATVQANCKTALASLAKMPSCH
jgi:hypothetical protein